MAVFRVERNNFSQGNREQPRRTDQAPRPSLIFDCRPAAIPPDK